MSKTSNIPAGTIVTSTYRVEPFLADETFYVVSSDKGRTYVQSTIRKGVAGWQYTDDLVIVGTPRRPTREDRRYRTFDRDGRPVWVSVPR